ncbi:MAG: hypothetical protein ACLU3F_15360 [Blautia wexlerae]
MKPADMHKKQNFLQGAGGSARMATIIVKVIGVLYKIPLQRHHRRTGLRLLQHGLRHLQRRC